MTGGLQPGLRIVTPNGPDQFDSVRRLCWDYRSFLLGLGPEDAAVVRLAYPRDTYAKILETLETAHMPPHGAVRLALLDGDPVGCGMSHRLFADAAEIKRVYVRDDARGCNAGRAIVTALVDQARADGLARVLMDTGKVLEAARGLYLAMGFTLRGPYQDVPEIARDRLIYFEMAL